MASVKTCDTFTATIYCGLKEGYTGEVHTLEDVIVIVQEYVNTAGLCVTVTNTQFVYTDGKEPGVIIGLINYPRFESEPSYIKEKAMDIAQLLHVALKQLRVTIVTTDETIMIGDQDVL